ncbi:MAG: chemotaxis protein CheR, partial [Lachnospiraceae bacterium]|nr:chemotaxis protein CheR [Lachnospiraceae bacterium]
MAYDYEWFKGQIFNITSINLNAYKEKQMKRRIDTLIGKYKVTGYDKFVDLLKKDKEVFDAFVNYLTINVSEFFRNKDQWELMDKQMIPTLIQRFGNRLDVWSAACSTGDEPYTLAMLLSRHVPLSQIHVLATDIDTLAIEKAKNGLYGAKDIAGVPADLKSKY